MSQKLVSTTGTRGIAAVSTSRFNVANTANKPSTHKHFAFAANYAAYAKRGSWSSIG
ncbi:MAG: hypothetical protein F2711_04330 [Actinobacteria bacterium]|nr:hypothetical protein [Actinomycetota bacterium]